MADTATAQNESVGNTSNNFEILLTKKPKTKEEAIEILRDIESTGKVGIRDIPNKSPLGKAINEFGGGLKYISIGAVIADLQKKTVAAGINVEREKEDKIDVEVETTKGKVDEKIRKAADKVSKDLGGNDKLNQLVKEETEKLVKDREIKTKKEAVKDLQEKMAKELGVEVNDEIRVNSRKVVETARNIEKNNPEEVNEIRRKALMKEIEDGYDKANPDGISDEQRRLVKEQAAMAADTFYTGKTIDSETRDVILAGSIWQGQANQANLGQYWRDTEGMIKLLQKSPEEVKGLQGKYAAIQDGLSSLTQPTNVRELASFNSMMGFLGNEGAMSNFNLGQSRLMGFADNFTGGAMGRAFSDVGSNFISRIGNESIRSFAENSFKAFVENGARKGFDTVLSGVLSGGAKAAATSAATAAAATAATTAGSALATAAGVAGGPITWVAMAGKLLLDGLKKLGKGLDNLFTNGKGNDENVNKVAKKWWLILILAPAFIMMGCSTTMISTLPPTQVNEKVEEESDAGDYGTITANNISVPICNPNVNSRAILRDIALSVENKVHYNNEGRWFVIGPHPAWGKKDTTSSWERRLIHPYYGMDCAKFVSWVWLQCMGKTRGGKELGGTSKLMGTVKKNTPGWHYIHPRSLSDLKIGDIFVRDNDWGNHAVIYIGNGQTMESARQNNNPFKDTVYSFSSSGVFLSRNKNRMNATTVYDHIIRIDNVFKD